MGEKLCSWGHIRRFIIGASVYLEVADRESWAVGIIQLLALGCTGTLSYKGRLAIRGSKP